MKQITKRREVGNLGEELVCRYLVSRGYCILDRNYLKKCGELDIVVKDATGAMRFIEVKSKSVELSGYTGEGVKHETFEKGIRPEDNVHEMKLSRLRRVIQVYLLDKHVSSETKWQFDVIVVYMDRVSKKSYIRHLENIVL